MIILALVVALGLIPGPGRVAPPVALPVRVVTVYHAVPGQTDDNPRITADGTVIERPPKYRYCAVSQELLRRNGGPIEFGDWLWVDVPGPLAGAWQVHDTMDGRVVGYVDLLVPAGVSGCWSAEGAELRHPEGCPDGAQVYYVGEW